jgi:hypothetical protein
MAAWRRFRACLEALPGDQAADLWRSVSAEIITLPHACEQTIVPAESNIFALLPIRFPERFSGKHSAEKSDLSI